MGHSLGAKLHLIVCSDPTLTALASPVPRAANVLVAYNNFGAAQSVPLLKELRSAYGGAKAFLADQYNYYEEDYEGEGDDEEEYGDEEEYDDGYNRRRRARGKGVERFEVEQEEAKEEEEEEMQEQDENQDMQGANAAEEDESGDSAAEAKATDRASDEVGAKDRTEAAPLEDSPSAGAEKGEDEEAFAAVADSEPPNPSFDAFFDAGFGILVILS